MDKQISLRISDELAKSIKDFNEQNPDTPLRIAVICRAAIESILKKARLEAVVLKKARADLLALDKARQDILNKVRKEVLVLEVVQEPREDKAPGT